MILGILLIVVGLVLLFKNLGLVQLPTGFWQLLYPVLIIVAGVYLTIGAQKGKKYLDQFWQWLSRNKNSN